MFQLGGVAPPARSTARLSGKTVSHSNSGKQADQFRAQAGGDVFCPLPVGGERERRDGDAWSAAPRRRCAVVRAPDAESEADGGDEDAGDRREPQIAQLRRRRRDSDRADPPAPDRAPAAGVGDFRIAACTGPCRSGNAPLVAPGRRVKSSSDLRRRPISTRTIESCCASKSLGAENLGRDGIAFSRSPRPPVLRRRDRRAGAADARSRRRAPSPAPCRAPPECRTRRGRRVRGG